MKQRGSKRVWAVALALILCLGLLPGTALADNDGSGGIKVTGLDMADATWTCNGGTAEWKEDSDTLTLNGTGVITGDGKEGISLPGGATLAVAAGAGWTVAGASSGDGFGKTGIYAGGALTVTVAAGASLDVLGGDSTSSTSGGGLIARGGALEITVESDGSLTAAGGTGVYGDDGISGAGVTLDNSGTVTARGGNDGGSGAGIRAYAPGLTVSGSGVLRCQGFEGIAAQMELSGGTGTATITGGTVIALGTGERGFGINAFDGALTVGAGAAVTAVGKNGGVRGTVSGDGVLVQATSFDENDHSTGLNLTGVTDAKLYTDVGGGAALWLPGSPNRLTLTGADITSGGLSLPGGETTLEFHGDNRVTGGVSLEAGADNALTLTGASRLAVYGAAGGTPFTGVDRVALAAPQTGWYATAKVQEALRDLGIPGTPLTGGASGAYIPRAAHTAFTLEYKARTKENLVIVKNGYGGIAAYDPISQNINCDIKPDGDNYPDFYGWEFYDKASERSLGASVKGAYINTPTEREVAVTIRGGTERKEFHVRAITEKPDTPTPPPAPTPDDHDDDGGDGPAAFHVVYRPGYDGPQSVRAGGYEEGERVTVRDNPFPAPQGRTFAGWSETETGPVAYRPGDVLTMPGQQMELYARWTGPAPALDREGHGAYLQGYADGTIRPGNDITREQTAAIFYRLLDQASRERYQSAASPFPDVAAERWSAPAIAAMAGAGILQGRRDGLFHPADPVTRAEFTAIAARLEPASYDGPDLFSDIAGHWAAEEINRAAQKGWVKGGADGRFRPDDPITRAEAAAMINRVLGRAPETAEDLLPGMRTFSDNPQDAWHYLDLQEAANAHDYTRKPDALHETWTALTPQP